MTTAREAAKAIRADLDGRSGFDFGYFDEEIQAEIQASHESIIQKAIDTAVAAGGDGKIMGWMVKYEWRAPDDKWYDDHSVYVAEPEASDLTARLRENDAMRNVSDPLPLYAGDAGGSDDEET